MPGRGTESLCFEWKPSASHGRKKESGKNWAWKTRWVKKEGGEKKSNQRDFFIKIYSGSFVVQRLRNNIIMKISFNVDGISGICSRKSGRLADMTWGRVQCHHNGIQFSESNILFSPSRTDPSRLLNVCPLAEGWRTDVPITNTAPGKLIKLFMTVAVHRRPCQAAPVSRVQCKSMKSSNNKPSASWAD